MKLADRIVFVLSERPEGLRSRVLSRYKVAAERLSAASGRKVVAVRYTELEARTPGAATVLSGSWDAWKLHDRAALARLDAVIREREGPVFGICAGMQTLIRAFGGTVTAAEESAGPGFEVVEVLDASDLLHGLPQRFPAFEHHQEEARRLPEGVRVLARSERCSVEAIAFDDRPCWGTQFHPEEYDDRHPAGRSILRNFFHLAGLT